MTWVEEMKLMKLIEKWPVKQACKLPGRNGSECKSSLVSDYSKGRAINRIAKATHFIEIDW